MRYHFPERFSRDMGCNEHELLGWLPESIGDNRLTTGNQEATISFANGGSLTLRWQPMPDRVLGHLSLPHIQIEFIFNGVEEPDRYAFMAHFDHCMQRGGG